MSYRLLTVPWLRAVCQRPKVEIRALNEYSNKYYYDAVLYLIEVSSDGIVCSFVSKTEKQDSISVYWLGYWGEQHYLDLKCYCYCNRIMRKMKNSNHLYPGNAQFVEIVNANVIGKGLAGNKLK